MNKNNSSDDFFGSDNEDSSNQYSLNKESDREIQRISPVGYSDGLEIGKEKTLQRGFNEGFKQASELSYKWSLLLGFVSSVDVFFHHNKKFANGKDTSVLGELVDKINKVIKDQCSSPTIDQLKLQFFNYKDDSDNENEINPDDFLNKTSISTTTTTTTTTTITTTNTETTLNTNNDNNKNRDECCSSTGKNKDEGCCKSDKSTKEDDCCGGNGDGKDEGCCKSNKSSKSDKEENNGCCGGKNNNSDEGCCKSNKTELELKEFKYIIEMGGKLFDELSKECVSTISSFGLNGQQMLDDSLAKKFRVTIN